jgi:poly(hydroxyalkanoate) granule-associated protein
MATTTRKESEFTLMQIPQDLIERGRGIVGRGHDVWLAGLGAFAAAEEEGVALFDRLVDRGRTVEDSGREKIGEVRDQVEARSQKVTTQLEEQVYEPMLGALRSFGVPTRREVRELSGKVDALTRQVEALLARMPGPAVDYTVYYVMAREDGWMVGKEGADAAVAVEPNKERALDRARELAHGHAPSRLHVYRKDGSIQDTFTYEE